jgi:hypothetical protein
MATYTRTDAAIPSGLPWDRVMSWSVLNTRTHPLRLQNTDDTVTVVFGHIIFDSFGNATAGTVTSICRFSTHGLTLLEAITGLNHPLAGLAANIIAPGPFLLSGRRCRDRRRAERHPARLDRP